MTANPCPFPIPDLVVESPDCAGWPEEVCRTKARADAIGLPVTIAENKAGHEALGCNDAASVRTRGMRDSADGIPVYDELKTRLYQSDDGVFVMVHLRGNEQVDEAVLRSEFGCELSIVDLEELDASKGLIHPLIELPGRVIHVFDEDCFRHYSRIGTLMTNAGHACFSMEFEPEELLDALRRDGQHVNVAVVREDPKSSILKNLERVRGMTLGIYTGNSYDTGSKAVGLLQRTFFRKLSASRIRPEAELSLPPFAVRFDGARGLSMDLRRHAQRVWDLDVENIQRLAASGASSLVIPCFTSSIFDPGYQQLCDDLGVRYISLANATCSALRDLDDEARSDVFVVGGKDAMDPKWGVYQSRFSRLQGNFHFPSADEGKDLHTAMEEIKAGRKDRGATILKKMVDARGPSTLVLCGTEFSELRLRPKSFALDDIVIVDGLQALARHTWSELFRDHSVLK